MTTGWWIYSGTNQPHDGIERLPDAPPWRKFAAEATVTSTAASPSTAEVAKARDYLADEDAIELVNAALYLRRPLLVTGAPGTGKSSLAYAIAHELQLGPVLRWPITSRVAVRDGLYLYDALARLYAASRRDAAHHNVKMSEADPGHEDVGRYIRLGPLGTALLPYSRPRVLLIDELDKSDLDFPNDLLTLFEDGEYEISELVRIADEQPRCLVLPADGDRVPVHGGRVQCFAFPVVVMTSNGEREFPPAFRRRCIHLELAQPDESKLQRVVARRLKDLSHPSEELIEAFLRRRDKGALATDQLLNAIYLTEQAARRGLADRTALAEKVMPYLIKMSTDFDAG
jgi:MoxR-like ATPase